ncbi:hypothetical protein UFOVP233_31 [uncultured Caudovirales phage]|uniref:Uncharacterized protein n=1 Tax=uncultured Caudovirales phage TaxID=2100421 RepID=A0A6J7WQF8_9CAUD|nr:hypothetical protein UFOVP233_31 [uncultured Caudovirales phage]
MIDFRLTPDMEAAILAAGDAIGAAKAKTKSAKPRANLTTAAWEAARSGAMPAPLVYPTPNHMQAHVERIFDLMQAGDRDGVAAYEIKGKKFYSRVALDYRAACLCFLDKPLAIPLLSTAAPKLDLPDAAQITLPQEALSPISVDDSKVANSVTKPKRKPAAKKAAA